MQTTTQAATAAATDVTTNAELIASIINVSIFSLCVTLLIFAIAIFYEKWKTKQLINCKDPNTNKSFKAKIQEIVDIFQSKKCEKCTFKHGYESLISENKQLNDKISDKSDIYLLGDALRNFATGMSVDVNGNICISQETVAEIRNIGKGIQDVSGVTNPNPVIINQSLLYFIEKLKQKTTRSA